MSEEYLWVEKYRPRKIKDCILTESLKETFGGMEPEGEAPTDEESDKFYDFVSELDYDRDDDWWTDRKGGYDVTFKYDKESKK